MKRQMAVVLGSTLALGMLAGCAHQQTASSAPTASTTYQRAATVMLDFSTDLVSAQQTVVSLHKGGAIDDATYKSIQSVFGQVATYGPQIDALIGAQAAAPTIQAKVTAAVNSLASVSAIATSGLDPNTAGQVKVAVQALGLLLSQLSTVFATSTSEVNFGPSTDRTPGRAALAAWLPDLPAGEGSQRRSRRAHEISYRHPGRSGRELRQGSC